MDDTTYTVRAIFYTEETDPAETDFQISKLVESKHLNSLYIAMGDARCVFSAADAWTGTPQFHAWSNAILARPFSNGADTRVTLLYNENYLTLNGDAAVTLAQGANYADAGASTPDGATITDNSDDVDTEKPGAYRIQYNAIKGCGVIDTAVRTVEVERDDTGPSLASATLDLDTGEMTITFDETIDVSATDLTKMHVSDAGEADEVALAGANFDSAAANSTAISMTLIQEQLDLIMPMSTPQLDIAAGAVADVFGNGIDAAPDEYLTTVLNPAPAGNLADYANSLLDGAGDVEIFETGGRIYAAVASGSDSSGGIQIVDVTDPTRPGAAGYLNDTGSLLLTNPALDIFRTGGGVYAAAASFQDKGIQIVDITNPANPSAAGSLSDANGSLLLSGARGVDTIEIGGSMYAAVTSFFENGLQLVDITNPANPMEAGQLRDDSTMEHARGVAAFESSGGAYAAVASGSGGLQIVDITNPDSPAAAGYLDIASLPFSNANEVAVLETDAGIYAILTFGDDGGIQLVNITDPASPAAVGSLSDGGSLLLGGLGRIDTFEAHGSTYAAVASIAEDGIQIVDVTNPDRPTAAGSIRDAYSLLLDGSRGVDAFMIGQNIYAAVASSSDNGIQTIKLYGAPAFASATLEEHASELIITFDETVDVSATDLTKMYVSDAGQANQILLAGAGFDDTAPDSNVISVMLVQDQLDRIISLADPQLDIAAGAVADPAGHAIADTPDGRIAVYAIGDDWMLWNATITSETFSSGTRVGLTLTRGDLHPHPPTTDNTFVFGGQTHIVTALVDRKEQLLYSLSTYPLIPESDHGSPHLVMDNMRCSFLSDDNDSNFHMWNSSTVLSSTPLSGGADTNAAIIYNPRYMALNGDDTVTVRQGSAYVDAGAATPDNATIVSNATNIDTAVPGTYKIHYNAAKGCNVLDTVIRTVDVADAMAPSFAFATLDKDAGELTVTFDETLDVSATDLSKLYASNAGEANQIALSGANLDNAASDSAAISMTLDSDQLRRIMQLRAPQLDIHAGAVRDLAGNAIGNTPDRHISILLAPAAAGSLGDNSTLLLGEVIVVDTFTIGRDTYAAAASINDHGLQLVNITDPDNPAAAGQLLDTQDLLLRRAVDADIFAADQNTYAAMTSLDDNGLQIVNVTDPADPRPVGNLSDNLTLRLSAATSADIFSLGRNTYAAVSAALNPGLQIVNVTNPADLQGVGSLTDDSSLLLASSPDVEAFAIGQSTYVAAASEGDHGLQLVNVTDPADPRPVGSLQDDSSLLLASANGVDIFAIGRNTYAALTSGSDHGLQLVNVTDPADPQPVGKLEDSPYLLLANASGVDIFAIGTGAYAAVASIGDHGLQLVNITDPTAPTPAGKLLDDNSTLLGSARSVHVFAIGDTPYAAVTSETEHGLQLIRLDDEPVQEILELSFATASLNYDTRVMTVTFSKTIDISAANPALMYVRDAVRAIQIGLAGAGFDNTAPDSGTISMTLSQAQMNRIIRMSEPQLDIRAGAVSDLDGNSIEASSGNRITPVHAPNSPPIAPAANAETTVNAPVTITPEISDPDGDAVRISAVSRPSNGAATPHRYDDYVRA